jgi:myo-inositol-1(or 4)-monophosphatase
MIAGSFEIGDKMVHSKNLSTSNNSGISSEDINLEEALMVALKASRQGREILLSYFGNLKAVESKEKAGLVSEADRESEIAIQKVLNGTFPQFGFLGEESSYLKSREGEQIDRSKIQWIVDPLDGTTNYIHEFPIYCISIGLEINGRVEVGVIDVPALGDTYTAIRGQGAFVNGRSLSVSKAEHLKDTLLATGFFAEDESSLQEQLNLFSKLVRLTRGVRRPGAAAFDLCMVARGVFDSFWERNLKPWDTAAGMLLVEEAGGMTTTYRGQNYNPHKNSIIAGNKFIVPQIVAEIQGLIRPETD